jgi:NitT/TauT family transport system substrate-binding protein
MTIEITRARSAALVLGGAALLGGASSVRARADVPIRIAISPVDNAAEVYYASDLGLFAKAGLGVQILQMQNGSAIAAGMAAGAIDIGYITGDALGVIHQKGVPIDVIAPGADYVTPASVHTYALVVPPNSNVRQAKDLDGKVIATVALKGLSETVPRAWIDANGGDSSTVRFTEIPYPAMPAAVAVGRVDAAFITEPFVTVAARHGRVLVYGLGTIADDFLIAGWCAMPQWVHDHLAEAKRFEDVILASAAWANRNHAASGKILAKYTQLDPKLVAMMTRVHYAEHFDIRQMQPLIDVSAKYNLYRPFPAQELLYAASR